jgi:hypothetical protein
MRVIAIDPGLDGCGIACFVDGRLVAAEGKAFPPSSAEHPGLNLMLRREKPIYDPRIREVIDYLADRAAHFCYAGSVDQGDASKCEVWIEFPPPFQFARTANRNQHEIQQLRLIVGGLCDRLRQRGFVVRGLYPSEWKPGHDARHQESAEATVRRVKQAVVCGAIPATPGLSINKTPPDIWTAIGICWKVATRRECEARTI